MSYTWSNAVTGITANPTGMGIVTNYAKTEDEANVVRLSNKTASLDAGELVTYSGRKIPTVNTLQDVINPAPTSKGVTYAIRLDEIFRITNADGTNVDLPIVAELSFRHPLYSGIDNSAIATLLYRLIAASYNDTQDTWRFESLMRSALAPESN